MPALSVYPAFMKTAGASDAGEAFAQAETAQHAGEFTRARVLLEEAFGFPALPPASRATDPEQAELHFRAFGAYCHALRALGDLSEEEACYRNVLRETPGEEHRLRARAWGGLAEIHRLRGELDHALMAAQDAAAEADQSGDALLRKIEHGTVATVLSEKGLLRDAARRFEEVLAIDVPEDRPGAKRIQAIWLNNVAWVALRKGDLGRAERLARQGLDLSGEGDVADIAVLRLTLAETLCQRGRLNEALRLARTVQRTAGQAGQQAFAESLELLARIAHARGKRGESAHYLKQGLAAARAHPLSAGSIHLCRLEFAVEDADEESFRTAYRSLQELADRSGSLEWRAELAFWLGRWAQRRGDREVAWVSLRRAARLYSQIGFSRNAGEARRRLSALPPVRRSPSRLSKVGELARPGEAFAGLLGQDPRFLRVLTEAAALAASRAPILIVGETGTGKELLARAIHAASPRASEPFVTLSCAALSPHLMESDLFGHETGAFTGASFRRRGRFELANHGTLLLDEIDSLPLPAQSKLLRVLSSGEIQPLGSETTRTVDVRILATVHREPEELVREGRLREDLLFRLNAATLRMPPLRDRLPDVPLLARHFLAQAGREMGLASDGENRIAPTRLSVEAEQLLSAYAFPGNARELENMIRRAVVLGEGGEVRPEHLPMAVRSLPKGTASPRHLLRDVRREAEQKVIASVLESCNGDTLAASRQLGISRVQLYRLANLHGLFGTRRRRSTR